MQDIGVGITTRNRPEALKSCLANLARYHTNEKTYVIVDDNSEDCDNMALVNDFRLKVNAKVIYRKSKTRLGIGAAKNACIAGLLHHHVVILLDDDCWPRKPGWSEHWAAACSAHDIHHSSFQADLSNPDNPIQSDRPVPQITYTKTKNGYTLDSWDNCNGVALLFTATALYQLGGYDVARSQAYYGYEHGNISRRAKTLGLTKNFDYPCPSDLSEWLYAVDLHYVWHGIECEFDMPRIEIIGSSVTPTEAKRYYRNEILLHIEESNLQVDLFDPMPANVGVDIVMATKCNDEHLLNEIAVLKEDPNVHDIVVIADGDETFNRLDGRLDPSVHFTKVPLATGLHHMWNIGLEIVNANNRNVAVINDDIFISNDTMTIVSEMMAMDHSLGLISPSDNKDFSDYLTVTTGFAGFCMVLAADLAREWRFDERMKWWYGDNDVLMWVSQTKGRVTGMTGLTHALGNKSHTINNHTPPNFHADIHNDSLLYKEKWG